MSTRENLGISDSFLATTSCQMLDGAASNLRASFFQKKRTAEVPMGKECSEEPQQQQSP